MEAAIFDLDGTLIDLFEVHYAAFRDVVRERTGLEFARGDLVAGYGLRGEEILELFFRKKGVDFGDVSSIAGERRARVIEGADEVSALPGAKPLLDKLRGLGVKTAVGTSARRDMTEEVLGRSGLRKYFDVVSTIDDVARGKPAPDIFLNAARAMGVASEKCAVFEDSPYGLRAAKAAKMKAVAVLYDSQNSRGELEGEGPDWVVESLSDVDVEVLNGLF